MSARHYHTGPGAPASRLEVRARLCKHMPGGGRMAALYLRLSKEDGGGESESISNQRAMLTDFAESRGFTICGVYADDGWSGTRFDRPAFMRMLGDIEAGRVDTVITKDMSRLGRDYIETGYYLERYFPERGVRYISLLDGMDTARDGPISDIAPFKAVVNDMYARDISRKIASVKRDKQKKGRFIGGKPAYGYKKPPGDKNSLIIDEPAAKVVRRIFALAGQGVSCRKIAETLNGEGVPPPAVYAGLARGGSGLWSSERIAFMLRNEVYAGDMVQGRVRKISYKIKKAQRLPPEQWTVVRGTHEPIVDRAAFERAGLLLSSRAGTRARTHDYPLKGLVHCHDCGGKMAVIARKNARGEPVLYLICRTYQRFARPRKCTSHCVRADAVTDAALGRARQIAAERADMPAMRRMALDMLQKADHGCDAQRLEARISALTARLDAIYADRLAGVLLEGDFERLYSRVREQRGQCERELEALRGRAACDANPEREAQALAQGFLRGLDGRALAAALIERVEVTAEKGLIIFLRCTKG